MLSHHNDNRAFGLHGPNLSTHADVVIRARYERARWIRSVAKRIWASLATSSIGNVLSGRRQRGELFELLALSDRTLADIGIRRSDLHAVIDGETTLEQLNAERLGGSRGALVELRRRERRAAPAPAVLDRAA